MTKAQFNKLKKELKNDYAYLSEKGYTDAEIKSIWERDLARLGRLGDRKIVFGEKLGDIKIIK